MLVCRYSNTRSKQGSRRNPSYPSIWIQFSLSAPPSQRHSLFELKVHHCFGLLVLANCNLGSGSRAAFVSESAQHASNTSAAVARDEGSSDQAP